MAKLDYKQEASRQVRELLDTGKLTPDLLIEWLDGFGWRWENWEEPYRMILDSLPLRSQEMPRYRELLAKVAARLLQELAAMGGYPRANISHKALGELFFLCACLSSPDILAGPLEDYYKTVSQKGIGSLDHTERVALRLAVERNQADDRFTEVWMQMIEARATYFPGTWEHGFDALGRCLHTRIDASEDNVESASIALIPVFRRALHLAQESALRTGAGEVEAAERINRALDYWETSCPGLKRPLLVFLFDSFYQNETHAWLKKILGQRLNRAEVPLLEKLVSAYLDEKKASLDQKQLVKMTYDSLEDAALSIVTPKRLLNLVAQLSSRCHPLPPAPPRPAPRGPARVGQDRQKRKIPQPVGHRLKTRPARMAAVRPGELSKVMMVGAEVCSYN